MQGVLKHGAPVSVLPAAPREGRGFFVEHFTNIIQKFGRKHFDHVSLGSEPAPRVITIFTDHGTNKVRAFAAGTRVCVADASSGGASITQRGLTAGLSFPSLSCG